MNLDANIKEQHDLAISILAVCDTADAEGGALDPSEMEAIVHDASRLAELVIALSEWRDQWLADPLAFDSPGPITQPHSFRTQRP